MLLFSLGLSAASIPAQALEQLHVNESAVVAGSIVDAETGDPLPNTHVFIASSTIGTVAGESGYFVLRQIPLGKHRLYATMIGFEPAYLDFVALADSTYEFKLKLTPNVIELGVVTVEARRDPRWEKRLRKFKRLFIGQSENARQTHIVNPEVLDFEGNRWGKLVARASAPLVIENHALGYRITYFLKEFSSSGGVIRYDGEPLFEELQPTSEAERLRWVANRDAAWYGSFRHFLQGLVTGESQSDGFMTYRLHSLRERHRNLPYPIQAEKIVAEGEKASERTIDFRGFIEVVFTGEEEDLAYLRFQGEYARRAPRNQRSWIELTNGPTVLDLNGEVRDPYGLTIYGYFAFERVADEVPKEYRPQGTTAIILSEASPQE